MEGFWAENGVINLAHLVAYLTAAFIIFCFGYYVKVERHVFMSLSLSCADTSLWVATETATTLCPSQDGTAMTQCCPCTVWI